MRRVSDMGRDAVTGANAHQVVAVTPAASPGTKIQGPRAPEGGTLFGRLFGWAPGLQMRMHGSPNFLGNASRGQTTSLDTAKNRPRQGNKSTPAHHDTLVFFYHHRHTSHLQLIDLPAILPRHGFEPCHHPPALDAPCGEAGFNTGPESLCGYPAVPGTRPVPRPHRDPITLPVRGIHWGPVWRGRRYKPAHTRIPWPGQ